MLNQHREWCEWLICLVASSHWSKENCSIFTFSRKSWAASVGSWQDWQERIPSFSQDNITVMLIHRTLSGQWSLRDKVLRLESRRNMLGAWRGNRVKKNKSITVTCLRLWGLPLSYPWQLRLWIPQNTPFYLCAFAHGESLPLLPQVQILLPFKDYIFVRQIFQISLPS